MTLQVLQVVIINNSQNKSRMGTDNANVANGSVIRAIRVRPFSAIS